MIHHSSLQSRVANFVNGLDPESETHTEVRLKLESQRAKCKGGVLWKEEQ